MQIGKREEAGRLLSRICFFPFLWTGATLAFFHVVRSNQLSDNQFQNIERGLEI